MTKHSQYSPSGASRWLACTASVKAASCYSRCESPYAFEGSVAHELAEKCLRTNNSPTAAIGRTRYNKQLDLTVTVTQEMADHVQTYINYINQVKESCFEPKVLIEERVSILNSLSFGTVDCLIVDHPNNIIHIIDLKYGKGVRVDAYKNEQLMMYALGMFDNRFKAELHVVMPRLNHFDTYTCEVDELFKFAQTVQIAIKDIQEDNTHFKPGEKQCLWCPHKANCEALTEHTHKCTIDMFDSLDSLDSLEQDKKKKEILDNKNLIIKFLSTVEADVTVRLKGGQEFTGYKLVEGRSNRKWCVDAEEALLLKLGVKAYAPEELIGVTEAQKKLGKTFVDDHTTKSEGKTVLVKDSDKRKSLSESIKDLL